MNVPEVLPGSFRDPRGRIYQSKNRIFRTVNPSFTKEFDLVKSTGLFKKLGEEGHVLTANPADPSVLRSFGDFEGYVLEVPKLPFVSFPYEWSFPALKAAALFHLDIHLIALDYGITLSDSSAYNVQFIGARPIFIDHLSFVQYQEGAVWAGHKQFCEQFLNPLLLRTFFGITHNAWFRGTQEGIPTSHINRLLRFRHYLHWNVLTHVVLQSYFHRAAEKDQIALDKGNFSEATFSLDSLKRILKGLHKWIKKMNPADTGKTIWRDYAKNHSYSSDEIKIKKQFIKEFIEDSPPEILWDLGCNTGDYSVVALDGGVKYVVGFDFDQGVLEKAFARAQEATLPFQALFMDASNPSPNQGWRELERQGFKKRANAGGIIALAFIHHLAIARNIPFDELLEWILSLAPKGIIEFVPKNDPMVKKLLSLREDIFPNYSEEYFLSFLATHSTIKKKVRTSKSGRLLVWYVKN